MAYEFTKTITKKKSRLFQCTHNGCNKTKVSISKLFSHIISHTRDKPYECQYAGCNMSFGYLGNFRKHILDAHGEKYISQKRKSKKQIWSSLEENGEPLNDPPLWILWFKNSELAKHIYWKSMNSKNMARKSKLLIHITID